MNGNEKDKSTLPVDSNLREIVAYPDPSFPLEIWDADMRDYLNTALPLHWHSEAEYAVIVSGHMIYGFREHEVELGPGDVLFVKPCTMHYTRQKDESDPVGMYTVAFPLTLLSSPESPLWRKYILPLLRTDFLSLKIEGDTADDKEAKLILERIHSLKDNLEENSLEAMSLLYNLWKKTLECITASGIQHPETKNSDRTREDESLRRALGVIHSRYSEKLTVDDIADGAYISRNSCFRYFRSAFNRTPLDVLNEYRLSVAVSLLKGDETITKIASSCGFGSSSYFTRFFRLKYGMPPQKCRENLKS
jgi:AraC family transcriptional regulator, melibiose operon regulatory protein